MPIQPTNKDISTRGITTANLSDFSGRDRQVVIQIDDPKGYRPVIMDGTTVGGKTKVALVADLSDYVSVSAYNSDKAGFETTAHASATYATKSELTSGLAGKADSSALASYATKTELASYAPLESPALTGAATLNGDTIATTDQIPSVPTLTASQTDLEAGVSELATGTFYFVYE